MKRGPFFQWEIPNPGHNYVAGLDSGEGLGQEYSVFDIYSRNTGWQVAQYVSNMQDPVEFSDSCIALCRRYNGALVVIESNNTGALVIEKFKAEYRHSRIWKEKKLGKVEMQKRLEYGWRTSGANRHLLIYDLKAGLKGGYIKIRSQLTLEQVQSFVRKKGRMEHADGEFDDAVFAAALAWQGFKDIMPKKELAESRKAQGQGITIGDYVKTVRGILDKKQKDYIIGQGDNREEFTVYI